MKKVLTVLLCVVCLLSLAACSSDGDSGSKASSSTAYKDVTGTTVSCDQFSALCPTGWSNSPCTDIFSDDGAIAPDQLMFVKVDDVTKDGGLAVLSNGQVTINHYDKDNTLTDAKSFYSDVVDKTLELDGVKWTGYTGKFGSYTNAVLWVDGSGEWQISMSLHDVDGDISLDDADVQAIIASIKAK